MAKLKPSDIENAAPTSAIDALRRNLLYAMLQNISEADMGEIVKAQMEKAKAGDTKSAKMIVDMLSASPAPSPSRERYIADAGGIVDYKLEIRKLIVCLIAFNGPQSTEDIAARLHLTGMVAMDALTCGWFNRDGGKWTLTNDARTKVLDVNAKLIAEDFKEGGAS